MSGVRCKFLMTLHQPAIVVIYFLPQPRGFFKLRFRIKNHFLEHYLPAPLATLPAKPITAAVIEQVFPIRPIVFVPLPPLAHLFHLRVVILLRRWDFGWGSR